ncbi:DUF4351 domain-containing protein [Clostridium hydrogenum]|uniref:DUF4351 domain-containing protein n=1 Tax=Clostridium hydrogenum TaxID=2855764 RepID=UPI001F15E8A8|nr:DUF4351 domain-containing protein [Clostridium hydrogenum]
MDYNKIEDTVLKKAMDIFKQSAVDFFGIDTKILGSAETEIKDIQINTNFVDYLFYTEDGNYLHFEFQTTDKKDDIKRFLFYDASLYYKEKRKVKTVVVYSADIDNTETFIDAGTIKYSIEAVYMKKLNGDEKLKYISEKVSKGEKLNPNDILTLTFLPLMSGKESRLKRALESIEIAENIKDNENKLQCISMLYALTDKFGDEISKKKLKEVFSMTDIGRMIREEGIEEGIEKGKAEGKSELLIKLLVKKFKKLPKEYIDKIRSLPEENIEIIGTEIFDFEKVSDLEKYF